MKLSKYSRVDTACLDVAIIKKCHTLAFFNIASQRESESESESERERKRLERFSESRPPGGHTFAFVPVLVSNTCDSYLVDS